MRAAPAIPRSAYILGWLGVIPFALLAIAAISGSFLAGQSALSSMVAYGAIILSFLGGAQWGLAMAETPSGDTSQWKHFTLSVLPSLVAFGAWSLQPIYALLGLALSFAAVLVVDLGASRIGQAPSWYPLLRIQLTSAVLACLLLTAAFGRA